MLNILAIPASSVPCEWLFSAGQHIATDFHSQLSADCFEQLQIMKSAWKDDLTNLTAWNLGEIEEVDMQLEDYEDRSEEHTSELQSP